MKLLVHQNNELLLDFILRNNKDSISRNKLKNILTKGCISVNGKAITQYNYKLHIGDEICIQREKMTPYKNFYSQSLKIIYEDNNIIIIDKACGVLSMQTAHHGYSIKTILDKYFRESHQNCNAHVVHRLDRDTSGLMIYAKNRDIQQLYEENWKQMVTDRKYIAVVEGIMEKDSGRIESFLKDDKFFFTFSSPVDNGGKLAITNYKVLKHNNNYSLVEFKLDTGRKNQIRVHSDLIGHPIVGDTKYGKHNTEMPRLCLHAYKLHLYLPNTNKVIKFETPIPDYFLKLVM